VTHCITQPLLRPPCVGPPSDLASSTSGLADHHPSSQRTKEGEGEGGVRRTPTGGGVAILARASGSDLNGHRRKFSIDAFCRGRGRWFATCLNTHSLSVPDTIPDTEGSIARAANIAFEIYTSNETT